MAAVRSRGPLLLCAHQSAARASDEAHRWRYRWQNGHWWYWTEGGTWQVYIEGSWFPYNPTTYATFYRHVQQPRYTPFSEHPGAEIYRHDFHPDYQRARTFMNSDIRPLRGALYGPRGYPSTSGPFGGYRNPTGLPEIGGAPGGVPGFQFRPNR